MRKPEPDPLAELMTITRYSAPYGLTYRPLSTAYKCRCGWEHQGLNGTAHREIAAAHAGQAHGVRVPVPAAGKPGRARLLDAAGQRAVLSRLGVIRR